MNKIYSFIIAAMLLMPVTSKAQTDFSFGVDFVGFYIWNSIFGQLAFNPVTEDVFLVFGISF